MHSALAVVLIPDRFYAWRLFAIILVITFFATDIFGMIVVAGSRRQIVQYMQNHQEEIELQA